MQCALSYSHAAEWAGKLAALQLAQHIGVPQSCWQWSIADNMSACLGADGGRPSGAPWVDLVRITFASLAAGSPLTEGYTPAAHNTGWDDVVARLQATCDSLAGTGARPSLQVPLPPSSLHPSPAPILAHYGASSAEHPRTAPAAHLPPRKGTQNEQIKKAHH